MKKVVFLTGAGASQPLRFPTTSEFYKAIPSNKELFDKILPTIFNILHNHKRSNDVEEVLDLLKPIDKMFDTPSGELITPAMRDSSYINELKTIYKLTRKFCFDKYSNDIRIDDVTKLYSPVLDEYEWQRNSLSLYTTNYDIVPHKLLQIAKSNSIDCYDGFTETGHWDISGYNGFDKGLKIYHLHGSVYWVKDNETEIKKINSLDPLRKNPQHTPEFIIFPGYKGNLENEIAFYSYPFGEFKKALKTADELVVIGFSFRDESICKAIIDSSKSNIKLRIKVIDINEPNFMNMFIFENKNWKGRWINILDDFASYPSHPMETLDE